MVSPRHSTPVLRIRDNPARPERIATAAKSEANKIVESARATINTEKTAAIVELKNQVAAISLEIAEKIIRGELSSDEKQKALAEKMAGDINLN